MSIKFQFLPLKETPVFNIAPHHARMCSCYQDRHNNFHLFVDYIDASLKTVHSWGAEIRYYRSSNLTNWKYVDTVIPKGAYYKNKPEESDFDCYGASCPHVICTDDTIYLFYSGRKGLAPGEAWDSYAEPGEKGYMASRIMLATAHADADGAPAGNFTKHGILFDLGEDWDSMRNDDPCAVLDKDKIHLYYKGFRTIRDFNQVKIGYASALVRDMRFTKHHSPILSVSGGCEMPRVFRLGKTWHMLLRHFEKGDGTLWKQYVSHNGLEWKLNDSNLFDCAGPTPGRVTDMAPVWGINGELCRLPLALATGMDEDGVLKLWAYELRIIECQKK